MNNFNTSYENTVRSPGGLIDFMFIKKDLLWLVIWLSGLFTLFLWNYIYLNKPSLSRVAEGTANTFFMAFIVVIASFIISWIFTNIGYYFQDRKLAIPHYLITHLPDLIRSIPQIIGILFGFVFIAGVYQQEIIRSKMVVMMLMSTAVSLFVFQELIDLMRDRINYFRKTDFFNAMIVCGISRARILNYHIIWKNSRRHIFNKIIALFGVAIFLHCSVDFIISVGLSTEISTVDLPVSLGNLLAHIDSKQDILAIGYAITHPSYISQLIFKNLQGITLAFIIVFSLFCIYKISNGIAERYRL